MLVKAIGANYLWLYLFTCSYLMCTAHATTDFLFSMFSG